MRFKNIDELSITECCDLLNIDRRVLEERGAEGFGEVANGDVLVVQRLRRLLEEDKRFYESCSTVEWCEAYLQTWVDGLYRGQVAARLSRLRSQEEETAFYNKNKRTIRGCDAYLKRYPDGEYALEAKRIRAKKKRKRRVRNIVILAIIVIVCVANYHPAKYLTVRSNISVSKYGGSVSVPISTNVDIYDIDVYNWAEWITIDDSDPTNLRLSLSANSGKEKTGEIEVVAYSTFFGVEVGGLEETINVTQASGEASELQVSPAGSLSFDKNGNASSAKRFTVKTDGVELQVVSSVDWISLSKYGSYSSKQEWTLLAERKSQGKYSHVESFNVFVEKNPSGSRTGKITIKSGEMKKTITVYQKSGLATYFRVERNSLVMGSDGTEEGYCFPVNVETDGTEWRVKEAPSWLKAYADLREKRLEVTLGPNSGDIKTGRIILEANNGDTQTIDVKQMGNPTDFDASRMCRFNVNGSYKDVYVSNNSDLPLAVSDDRYWIEVEVKARTKIRISCNSNYNGSPRKGVVTVRCGSKSLAISVIQAGYVKCERCEGEGVIEEGCDADGFFSSDMWNHYRYYWRWNGGKFVHIREGVLNGAYHWEYCDKCGGDGKIIQDCPSCEDGKKKSYNVN